MTIEQAIKHAREVAEERKDLCEDCRNEHLQLALWLEELKSYKDKIEQGTLIELPCKVGDTAYHLTSANTLEELGVAEIFDGEVTSISKDKDGLWISCHYNNGLNFWYSKREIGRKLFFTREEAENRLKELQNG